MSTIFEELNDLITDHTPGKVIGVALLIMIFSAAVALGFAYWLTHRH